MGMIFIPGGNGTIIPVPTGSSSGGRKPEDPKCPHCKKKLKGWTKPSKFTFTENVIGFSIVALIIINFIAAIGTAVGASYERCDPFFSKRYHYIVPASPAACAVTRWMINKEKIFNND